MWVRGLKLVCLVKYMTTLKVAPYVGAWIETCCYLFSHCGFLSHPMWVRGLKLHIVYFILIDKVAPYVGAWIETIKTRKKVYERVCRTLCGCVD